VAPNHFLHRFAVFVNRMGITVAELGLLALMLLTVYGVVARYVFGNPSVHAIEVSAYLLVLVTWSSLGWVHLEDRHVCMEALNTRLAPGWKRFSELLAQLTVLVFCICVAGAGVMAAWTNYAQDYKSASLLEFPLWIAYAAIPAGALLLAFVALARLGKTRPAGTKAAE